MMLETRMHGLEAPDFAIQHCCSLNQHGLRFEPVPAVIGMVNEVGSKS